MKIFCCFLILASFIHSQDSYVNYEYLGYGKKEIVDSLISINTNSEYDTILYFSTLMFNDNFADDETILNQETTPLIFLVYRKGGINSFQILYKNKVSMVYSLQSNDIFNYKFISKTGVIKDETGLKVTPPLDYSFSDIVLFISPKQKFYFEYGHPSFEVTISADKTRKAYRKEWISIIKNELANKFKEIDLKYFNQED